MKIAYVVTCRTDSVLSEWPPNSSTPRRFAGLPFPLASPSLAEIHHTGTKLGPLTIVMACISFSSNRYSLLGSDTVT